MVSICLRKELQGQTFTSTYTRVHMVNYGNLYSFIINISFCVESYMYWYVLCSYVFCSFVIELPTKT